jgi:hypothetical protein
LLPDVPSSLRDVSSLFSGEVRRISEVVCQRKRMGNFLFADNENPIWNNLPPEHTAKEAKDLDELFSKLRSYGGVNGMIEEDEDEDQSNPTPSSKYSPSSKYTCNPSPLTQSNIIFQQSTKIYPEPSQSTSQKSPAVAVTNGGRALVSLR